MKKWIALFLVLTVLLSVHMGGGTAGVAPAADTVSNLSARKMSAAANPETAGGSAVTFAARANNALPAAAPMMAMADEAAVENDDAGAAEYERKIVKNCWMSLETQDFETAVSNLIAMAENAGGYVQNQSLNQGKASGTYRRPRSASLTLKIPAEKLDEVLSQVGGICHIVSSGENTNDITDTYYDASAHLDNMKAKETRLLELLAQAEKVEDIIQIETALADTRSEIESLTGRLRRMDQQVAYSTLDVSLSEVVEYTEPTPMTFTERLSKACSDAVSNVRTLFENVCISVISYGPVAAVEVGALCIVLACLLSAVKGAVRRRKNKTEEKTEV